MPKSSCRIYGIKNCDTMKKAFAWLDEHGVDYEFVDYKKAGIMAERLPHWANKTGWQTLLNTRGLTWKRLSDTERSEVDETKARQLMEAYPALVKRPVVELDDTLVVGFDLERYAQIFAA